MQGQSGAPHTSTLHPPWCGVPLVWGLAWVWAHLRAYMGVQRGWEGVARGGVSGIYVGWSGWG